MTCGHQYLLSDSLFPVMKNNEYNKNKYQKNILSWFCCILIYPITESLNVLIVSIFNSNFTPTRRLYNTLRKTLYA